MVDVEKSVSATRSFVLICNTHAAKDSPECNQFNKYSHAPCIHIYASCMWKLNDSMVVQWLALSPHGKKFLGSAVGPSSFCVQFSDSLHIYSTIKKLCNVCIVHFLSMPLINAVARQRCGPQRCKVAVPPHKRTCTNCMLHI